MLKGREHNLDRHHRHTEPAGKGLERPGRGVGVVVSADERDNQQGDFFLDAVAELELAPRRGQQRRVLMVTGDAGADEHDEPVQIQPDHREDHNREAGVDRRVLGRSRDEGGEAPAEHLPQDPCDGGAHQRRYHAHARVGHEHIDEAEGCDHEQERKHRCNKLNQGTQGFDRDQGLHSAAAEEGRRDTHGREGQ